MNNKFLELSDFERQLLNGKIVGIEPLDGCCVNCFTCSADAEKRVNYMPWIIFSSISDDLAEVSVKTGKSLLNNTPDRMGNKHAYIYLFGSSDPIYYHSMDGQKLRTSFDASEKIIKDNNKGISFTTAGWSKKITFMQNAIENMIDKNYIVENGWVDMWYSVKTVAYSTRQEYKRFKAKYGDSVIDRFIDESLYAKQLRDNLTTLSKTNAKYLKQYLNNNDMTRDSFPKDLAEISDLFSMETVEKLFYSNANRVKDDYILSKWDSRLTSNKWVRSALLNLDNILSTNNYDWARKDRCRLDFRDFSGIGRAIHNGLKPDVDVLLLDASFRSYLNGQDHNIDKLNYWVTISFDGRLSVKLSFKDHNSLIYLTPTREEFMRLSDVQKTNAERSKLYAGLASIQDKSILR